MYALFVTSEQTVKQIFTTNSYMTLASLSDIGPWACALFMGVDDEYNLYFESNVHSQHVRNVIRNPKVAVVIFDSQAVSGDANGVQLTGICQRLIGDEIQQGIGAIYMKRYPDPADRASHNITVEEFSRPDSDFSAHHIYRIVPDHIYTLGRNMPEDTRVEIDIAKLKKLV